VHVFIWLIKVANVVLFRLEASLILEVLGGAIAHGISKQNEAGCAFCCKDILELRGRQPRKMIIIKSGLWGQPRLMLVLTHALRHPLQ
jgi:hypothetical protein